MTMNRRNVLIGLGTIVAGGGAALGTGAFSSVEAERTVNIETADDSDAFLQIRANSEYDGDEDEYVDDEDGIVSINIGEEGDDGIGVNRDAVTTFEDLLEVENAGTQNVGFYVRDDENLGDGEELDFRVGEQSIVGDNGSVDLAESNGSETVTIRIDLTGDNDEGSIPENVMLVADADQYEST